MPSEPLEYQSLGAHEEGQVSFALIWVLACIGILLTVPGLFLALLSSGGGHGDYFFARAIFPYPMLLTRLGDGSIALPSIVLAFFQLPLEGF